LVHLSSLLQGAGLARPGSQRGLGSLCGRRGLVRAKRAGGRGRAATVLSNRRCQADAVVGLNSADRDGFYRCCGSAPLVASVSRCGGVPGPTARSCEAPRRSRWR
jgi:hypothetical protein